jgi:anti-sigma B factor antagonist
MNMSLKSQMIGDVAILTIKGKLMGGQETEDCHQKVKSLIEAKHTNIVADLSKVKWVNSKGLGMLMACFTSCKNAKGDFKLAGATDKVNSLLMMTKLMTIFETFDSVDKAVSSF